MHYRSLHHRWLLFGVCIALGVGLVVFAHQMYVCTRLSCLGQPVNNTWQIQEVYEQAPGNIYRALYTAGDTDTYVRVDVRSSIEPDIAVDYIRGRIGGMKALYDNIRSPYPGLLSNEIVCDEAYKPVYGELQLADGTDAQIIRGYFTDRMTFGACQKDQAVYQGVMALFWCDKAKQLFQIEFIVPIHTFHNNHVESYIQALSCR